MNTLLKTISRAWVLLLSGALAAGCINPVSEEGRPCPCAPGWTCCADAQVCVADAVQCGRLAPVDVPDITPPLPPQLLASIPASPSARRDVFLDAQSEADARVDVYADVACEGAPAGSATADAAGAVRIPVALAENTVTTFHARATDRAGNASLCSALEFAVMHDGSPPLAPVMRMASGSTGPTRELQPLLAGVAEPGAQVLLFADAACTRSLEPRSQADAVGAFQVRVTVTADSLTRFFAQARDAAGNTSTCSTALEVRHDGQPPAPLTWSTTSPPSPSRERAFTLTGQAEPRSRVVVYLAPGCEGPVHADVLAPQDGVVRFALEAPDQGALAASATATDAAGNTSACSDASPFVHDVSAPTTPMQFSYEPASPSYVSRPLLKGQTEPRASVYVYRDTTCTGTPEAVVQADAEGFFAAQVGVWTDSETRFVVRSIDAAGNASSCVSTIAYRHDATPPTAPVLLAATSPTPSRIHEPASLWIRTEYNARITLFTQSGCQGVGQTPSSSPSVGSADGFTIYSIPVAPPAPGTSTTYSATVVDTAGNVSECSPVPLTYHHTPGAAGWEARTSLDAEYWSSAGIDDEGVARLLDSTYRSDGGSRGYSISTRTSLADGGWSEPVEVMSGAATGGSLAVGPRGDTAVVARYLQTDGGTTTVFQRFLPDGTRLEPEQVPQPPALAFSSSAMAVDEQGRTHIVQDSSSNGQTLVTSLRHVPGMGWEAPIEVARMATPPSGLVASRSGAALLYWKIYVTGLTSEAWVARFRPEQGWEAPVKLTSNVLDDIAIDLDDSGRAIALWQEPQPQGSGRRLSYRTQVPGEAWTVAQPLPGARGGTLGMSLDVGGSGEALAAWVESRPDNNTALATHVSRYTPGSGWSEPRALPTALQIHHGVRAAMLPDGTGLAFTVPGYGILAATPVDALGVPGSTGYVSSENYWLTFDFKVSARGDLLVWWQTSSGGFPSESNQFHRTRWWRPTK